MKKRFTNIGDCLQSRLLSASVWSYHWPRLERQTWKTQGSPVSLGEVSVWEKSTCPSSRWFTKQREHHRSSPGNSPASGKGLAFFCCGFSSIMFDQKGSWMWMNISLIEPLKFWSALCNRFVGHCLLGDLFFAVETWACYLSLLRKLEEALGNHETGKKMQRYHLQGLEEVEGTMTQAVWKGFSAVLRDWVIRPYNALHTLAQGPGNVSLLLPWLSADSKPSGLRLVWGTSVKQKLYTHTHWQPHTSHIPSSFLLRQKKYLYFLENDSLNLSFCSFGQQTFDPVLNPTWLCVSHVLKDMSLKTSEHHKFNNPGAAKITTVSEPCWSNPWGRNDLRMWPWWAA